MENRYEHFTAFCVGQKIMEPTFQDGPKFDLTENGFALLISYQRPTAAEIREVETGKAQFHALVKDGILVILARFGNIPWMDMTFNRQLAQCQEVIRPEPGYGTALHVMLVDSTTGVLAAQRVIGLKNTFSHALADMIEAQESVDLQEWKQKVSRLYQQYTTKQLLKLSQYRN